MTIFVNETFDDASPYFQVIDGSGTCSVEDGQLLCRSSGGSGGLDKLVRPAKTLYISKKFRMTFDFTIHEYTPSNTYLATVGYTTADSSLGLVGVILKQSIANIPQLSSEPRNAGDVTSPTAGITGGSGTFVWDPDSGLIQLYASTSNGTTFSPYPSTATNAVKGSGFSFFGGYAFHGAEAPGPRLNIGWDNVVINDADISITIGTTAVDPFIREARITEQLDAAGQVEVVLQGVGDGFVEQMVEYVSASTAITVGYGITGTTVWTGFIENVQANTREKAVHISGRDYMRTFLKTTIFEESQFNAGGRSITVPFVGADIAGSGGSVLWNNLARQLVDVASLNHFLVGIGSGLHAVIDPFNASAASTTDSVYSYEFHTCYDAMMDSFRNTGFGYGEGFKHFFFSTSSLLYIYPRDPIISDATAIDRWVADSFYRVDSTEKYDSMAWFYRTSESTYSSSTWAYWILQPGDGASHRAASSSSFSEYHHFRVVGENLPAVADAQTIYDTLSTTSRGIEILANSLLLGDVRPYTRLVHTDSFLGLSSATLYVRKILHTISQTKRESRMWFEYAGSSVVKATGPGSGGVIAFDSSAKNRDTPER